MKAMRTIRRLLALAVVLALPMAAVGIAVAIPEGGCFDPKWWDYPKCEHLGPTPTTLDPSSEGVTVAIDASLDWAHEPGDLIIFTISATNDSDRDVLVTTGLTDLYEILPAGGSLLEERRYFVSEDDVGWENPTHGVGVVGDTVIAWEILENGEVGGPIDGDSALSIYTPHAECIGAWDEEARTFTHSITSWGCILTPPASGSWTLILDPGPVADPKKPNRVQIALEDHIHGNNSHDGNVCGQITERWRMGDDPIVATFVFPQWPASADFVGQPVCGGDAPVGTPDSFYLIADGLLVKPPWVPFSI